MLKPVMLAILLLILFLITGKLFNAHMQQGGNIAGKGCNAVSSGEELLDDVVVATAATENQLGGRKMALVDLKMIEKMKENGANLQVGVALNLGGQQSLRSLLSEKMDVAGLVAFSADYTGVKYHPPKNN
ncbi:unnamed protein product [Ilex paraguariensis]